jgi:hypothetical protein
MDGLDGDPGGQPHALAGQLLADQLAELGVDGGHGRRGLLDHGDLKVVAGEGLGHLQADVAGPHDHRPARPAGRDGLLDGEHVGHAVQQVHAGQVQAGDRWARRDAPVPTISRS